MSPVLIAACLWVFVATAVAFLPMRLQYPPGILLLIAAPVLLVWIGVSHGGWIALAATIGFLSMFRNPLRFFVRRAMGEKPEVPR